MRRSSEMERVRTSSVTNVSDQTALRIASLDTGSPGWEARQTKTSITFGSTGAVVRAGDGVQIGLDQPSPDAEVPIHNSPRRGQIIQL